MQKRHRYRQADLSTEGFRDLVVSFEWPSADSTVNYLKDVLDASEMSIRLVSYVIVKLAARQRAGCRINIHLLGHLTGAYAFRVAFYNA